MFPKFMQQLIQKFFCGGVPQGFFTIDKGMLENIIYGHVGGVYRVLYFIGSQYAIKSKEGPLDAFVAPKCRFHVKVTDFTDFSRYSDCIANYKSSTPDSLSRFDHNYIKAMCSGKTTF